MLFGLFKKKTIQDNQKKIVDKRFTDIEDKFVLGSKWDFMGRKVTVFDYHNLSAHYKKSPGVYVSWLNVIDKTLNQFFIPYNQIEFLKKID